ncbi:hypothetical protein LTR84_011315 [Exophiala bonariae]|uniref:Transcription factor domain-containing protein n=1 Tax=Exophiala bonariae TaxID=1690606 RepID=A0AAV9MVM1_9EURO|nr:hypothetical protein LTR84_011315 [Exophiala bonariae]
MSAAPAHPDESVTDRKVCTYPAVPHRANRAGKKDSLSLRRRLEHVETLLTSVQERTASSITNAEYATREAGAEAAISFAFSQPQTGIQQRLPGHSDPTTNAPASARPPLVPLQAHPLPPTANAAAVSTAPERPLVPPLTITVSQGDMDDGSVSSSEEEASYEFYGPGSFISFCSHACVEWTCDKTGVTDFAAMAREIAFDISRHLKVEPGLFHRQEPEPEQDRAWQYVNVYFEECRDVVLGIVCRPVFESRLRKHFKNGSMGLLEQDCSWYALRNAVYATGCRKLLSREQPGPFFVGEGHGWEYLKNALSVHTELLYSRSNSMAVQALAIMALFVESIASPALDYMLSLSAMKFAESRGFHRQPAAAWHVTESALQTRWGRPLSIDDNVITCHLPSKTVDGSMVDLDLFVPWIKHAQVSGHITKQITALKASTPTLDEVVRTIAHLERGLREWHDSLPSVLRIETDYSDIPQGLDPTYVFYMQYAFLGGLITIHSLLAHPWNAPAIQMQPGEVPKFGDHTAQSMTIIVDASRQIIRILQHVTIDVCSPRWLVFITPLTAFMNLFFYIIQYPTLVTVKPDLDCMYQVCGHFNYLEYMSPGIKFSFPRRVTNLARLVVTKASSSVNPKANKRSEEVVRPTTTTSNPVSPNVTMPALYDASLMDILNLDNEPWGNLVSWPSGDEVAIMNADFQNYRDLGVGTDANFA